MRRACAMYYAHPLGSSRGCFRGVRYTEPQQQQQRAPPIVDVEAAASLAIWNPFESLAAASVRHSCTAVPLPMFGGVASDHEAAPCRTCAHEQRSSPFGASGGPRLPPPDALWWAPESFSGSFAGFRDYQTWVTDVFQLPEVEARQWLSVWAWQISGDHDAVPGAPLDWGAACHLAACASSIFERPADVQDAP